MSEAIDGAVADVLSSKRIKLVHPGAGKLTQMYATPEETTSVLAETINHRGQYRVSSNNLALGAQSNFSLSTSAIIDGIMLVFAIKSPDNAFFSHEGWGFDLIESFEVTYPNSLMQNMIIRGDINKEYCKLCCCSKDEREQMLVAAGPLSQITGSTKIAAVPLSFLNFNTAGQKGSWPLDASVLAGPVQIYVNWVSQTKSSRIFVDSNIPALVTDLPTSLSSAEITVTTSTLQRASFGVKDAMSKDRSLVYSIPARYLSIVNESRVVSTVQSTMVINLNSAPAGMLEGILLYVAPNDPDPARDNWESGAMSKRKHSGSVIMDEIRLEFGSQDLVRYKSRQEMTAFNRSIFGDTLTYASNIYLPGGVSGAAGYTNVESEILFIPLIFDGREVFNGHTNEHVPSYGGSQLQLTLKMSSGSDEITPAAASAHGPSDGVGVVTQTFQIWICYIISAIFEVSQGTADLQL